MRAFLLGAPLLAWLLTASALCQVPSAKDTPANQTGLATGADLPLDRIVTRDGDEHEGILEEKKDPRYVHLLVVKRQKGHAMLCYRRRIQRVEIAKLDPLDPAVREKSQAKIQAHLDRKKSEEDRMEEISLTQLQSKAWQFECNWFTLVSSADEELTRRAIARIEQVFDCYTRLLPPRTKPARPLTILIFGSTVEYRAFLKKLGLSIENPAFFNADENVVAAASDLTTLTQQLEEIRQQHRGLRRRLDALTKRVDEQLDAQRRQLIAKRVPPAEIGRIQKVSRRAFEKDVHAVTKEMAVIDRRNQQKFDQFTQQMFSTLYHEAFHAYLENYVYPHDKYDVPRWLNEGLAQLFENGFLELGEMRVDAPDRDRLRRLRADLRSDSPLSLAELLAADHRSFLVTSRDAGKISSQSYLYAWGIAYYLAIKQNVLTSDKFDDFVSLDERNRSQEKRLEALVGAPLAEFEKTWRHWVVEDDGK